jgi:malonyl CoA-acyl carrier protein transacylase
MQGGAVNATWADRGTAILFPGQGSQTPGMRETVESGCPDLLDHALSLFEHDPFEHCSDRTDYLQVAVFCASLAGYEQLKQDRPEDLEPDLVCCFAGHSLGELTALTAAGALGYHEGLELVARRGRIMQEAAGGPAAGGMLAVGAGIEEVRPLAEQAGAVAANDNSPQQVVVSGDAAALEIVERGARARDWKFLRLDIAGAFHSGWMEGAARRFARVLDETSFSRPCVPVISCVTAAPFDDIRRRLAESLANPVLWRESLHTMAAMGVRRTIEVGPGRALTGLVRRTLPGVEAIAVKPTLTARA